MTKEKTEQETHGKETEQQKNRKLLRLKTGSVTIENGTLSVLYITSPNISSDSSVN
jgi:hypothetical protein